MPPRDRTTARPPDRTIVRRFRTLATALILLLIGLGVGLSLRRGGGAARPPRIVSVYGYSALDEVLQAGILPAFRRVWMEREGEGVEFVSTFAGSGALTERLLRQVPAQVVFLASELDAHLLEARGAIDPAARARLPQSGVYARTPLAILVRPGNPKRIRDLADLARPGVAVVLADPATSGSAQWAILAAYGVALRRSGGGEAAAAAELRSLRRNGAGHSANAREARIAFASGVGDALLTYEQELVGNPLHAGAPGEIVLPPATILCEPVVALVERNVAPRDRELVSALVRYLFDEEAQSILGEYGFRPAAGPPGAAAAGRAEVAEPFTLADLGGAERARREILEEAWGGLAAGSSP